MKEALSLYIHIPFCVRKCAYCDFCSYPGETDKTDAYITALERELRAKSMQLSVCQGANGSRETRIPLKTLYIGGGTPTLLRAEQISRVLRAVSDNFSLLPGAEATMEANPGTLTREKLDACVQGGINRISMGMQAYQPELLKTLGRIHDFAQVEQGVRMAREAGIENVSVDLMYALPGQTLEAWEESLDAALSLGVKHISCYELIVEEGTPIEKRISCGELTVPDEELCLAMAELAREKCAQHGLHRYEISNYAKAGFESVHNKTYWKCEPYIGVGCAAHGYDTSGGFPGVRYENTTDLDAYIAGEGTPLASADVTVADARFERLMLSLRMISGLDTARFERDFQMSVHEAFGPKLAQMIAQGLLEEADGFLFCTPRGMDVQSALLVELMESDKS